MNKLEGSRFHAGGRPTLKPFSYGRTAVYLSHKKESEIGLNIAVTINRTSALRGGGARFGQDDGISLIMKIRCELF